MILQLLKENYSQWITYLHSKDQIILFLMYKLLILYWNIILEENIFSQILQIFLLLIRLQPKKLLGELLLDLSLVVRPKYPNLFLINLVTKEQTGKPLKKQLLKNSLQMMQLLKNYLQINIVLFSQRNLIQQQVKIL